MNNAIAKAYADYAAKGGDGDSAEILQVIKSAIEAEAAEGMFGSLEYPRANAALAKVLPSYIKVFLSPFSGDAEVSVHNSLRGRTAAATVKVGWSQKNRPSTGRQVAI